MGLRDKLRDVRRVLLLARVLDRLRKERAMKHLLTALYALAGMVLTAIVAQVTAACPDLMSQLPVILTGTIAPAIALVIPRQGAAKATLAGIAAACIGALAQQINAVCGADFVQQLPALATAGLWTALGLYLSSPHEPKG